MTPRKFDRRAIAVFVWLAALAACGFAISRASFSTDLSAFLPSDPSPEQALLVEQLREGVASRVMLIAIEGGDPSSDAARMRAAASKALVQRLRASSLFSTVENGATDAQAAKRWQTLFDHRYALSPRVDAQRFSAPGLRAAIDDALAWLGSPEGNAYKAVFTRDPTAEIVELATALQPADAPRTIDGAWTSRDGARALLLAATRATGADIDAQQRAIDEIHGAFAAITHAPDVRVLVTGPGAFSVDSRNHIRGDVVRLSTLGSLLVAGLVFAAFGSLLAVGLAALPVASGVLAGIASVAAGFSTVHGVTVGFGSALIGEAVDYAIYWLVQSREPGDWLARWWPTVRLGLFTSLCGFAALAFSSFPGLAQLGVFACAGLIAAALVTRFVLPILTPPRLRMRSSARVERTVATLVATAARARWIGVALCVLALMVIGMRTWNPRSDASLWSHELLALSPLGAPAQALDAQLRADLGTPDASLIVVIEAADAQATLETAEAVGARLDALVAQGALAAYESPARWLPSARMQRMRLNALPPPDELRTRLATATEGSPVAATTLAPFVEDVRRARDAAPLDRAALDGTPLAAAVDALMFQRAHPVDPARAWAAALTLHPAANATLDLERLANAIRDVGPGHAHALDIKREADRLYADYLHQAIVLVLLGAAAIVALLATTLRSPTRVARVLAPLVAATIATLGLLAALGQTLHLLHLVGLLLVVAVGSNYALFFDAIAHAGRDTTPATRVSLLVANLTTVGSFGLLAWSEAPALHAIGSTVGPGALLAFWLSAAWITPRRLA